jgi:hypothetical protein
MGINSVNGQKALSEIKLISDGLLGPLIFVAPSFYDEGGRGKRIGRNLLLSLVVFVAFGALFVLIGEAGG